MQTTGAVYNLSMKTILHHRYTFSPTHILSPVPQQAQATFLPAAGQGRQFLAAPRRQLREA